MIDGKRVLGLIAARGGSKGIPGKNIFIIEGRPLIQWTIEAAKESKYIDRLILSSDDHKIIEIALRLGCEVPFCREPWLADDEASSIDVTLDALKKVPGYDIVVLLQPTSPLRNVTDIDGVIELISSSGAPACVSVRDADDHPYLIYRFDANSCLENYAPVPVGFNLRRQNLPPAWCLNGAVYAASVNWFLHEKTFISDKTVGYPMPKERSLDIDTHADIENFKSVLESVRLKENLHIN